MENKPTGIQVKAARLIASRNDGGMGARMPYAELIHAADELEAMGLAEWRKDRSTEGRWLTEQGLAVLSAIPNTGGSNGTE